MRSLTGLFLTASGVLACPCHLPFTLPLLLSVLGETSLGLFVRQNPSFLFIGASVYFLTAIGVGLALLGRSGGNQSDSADCCHPSPTPPDNPSAVGWLGGTDHRLTPRGGR